jgi:hypothetical protein
MRAQAAQVENARDLFASKSFSTYRQTPLASHSFYGKDLCVSMKHASQTCGKAEARKLAERPRYINTRSAPFLRALQNPFGDALSSQGLLYFFDSSTR